MALEHLVVFLRVEHAAERRLDAKHREVVAGDQLGVDPLGLVVDAHRRGHEAAAEHLRQRLGLLLQILVERVRVHARAHVAAHVRALLVEHHQLVGGVNGQLAQQELVDQREDRGVGADAERQGEDGDGGKQRAAAKAAERQAEVVQKGGHEHLTEFRAPGLAGVAGDS